MGSGDAFEHAEATGDCTAVVAGEVESASSSAETLWRHARVGTVGCFEVGPLVVFLDLRTSIMIPTYSRSGVGDLRCMAEHLRGSEDKAELRWFRSMVLGNTSSLGA